MSENPSTPPADDDSRAEITREETESNSLSSPSDSVQDALELDDVFTALAHPRRRYLLYTLLNGESEETLSDLAVKIAAWEKDKPLSAVTDDEQTRVYVSLYHSHIPKLTDLGIVEYQETTDVIVRAVNTEQVAAVLHGAGAELDSRQETHARDTDAKESK